jgi:hypothetical protein
MKELCERDPHGTVYNLFYSLREHTALQHEKESAAIVTGVSYQSFSLSFTILDCVSCEERTAVFSGLPSAHSEFYITLLICPMYSHANGVCSIEAIYYCIIMPPLVLVHLTCTLTQMLLYWKNSSFYFMVQTRSTVFCLIVSSKLVQPCP